MSIPVPGAAFAQRWEYDANGNVVARTDANGAVTRYDYDALDGLTAIRYPDGSKVSYAYDVRGRRTEMRDSLGTTRYKYDDLDRLIEVTDANGNTVKYEYDLADNLTALVYPDGQRVTYQYDALGRLEKVTDSAGITTYRYNESGQVVGRTLPNGVTTGYDYDGGGRLTGVKHTNPSGQLLMAFAYTLDAAGNTVQTVQTMADGRRLTTSYLYDEVYRLTQVTHPDGRNVKYRYDQAGDRLEVLTPQGSERYEYDAQDRLVRAGATTFTYDARGNRIEKREGDKVTRYRYDHENRLIELNNGGQAVTFAYDGDGVRLRKSVNGTVTKYVYDLSGELPEIVAEVGPDGRWARYPLGWERLGELGTQASNRFYLTDGAGTVVGLLDERGQLVATYSYDPFGVPLDTPFTAPGPARGLATSVRPVALREPVVAGESGTAPPRATPVPAQLYPTRWFAGLPVDPGTNLFANAFDATVGRSIVRQSPAPPRSSARGTNSLPGPYDWLKSTLGTGSSYLSRIYARPSWDTSGQAIWKSFGSGMGTNLARMAQVTRQAGTFLTALDFLYGALSGAQANREGQVGLSYWRLARPTASFLSESSIIHSASPFFAAGPWGGILAAETVVATALVSYDIGLIFDIGEAWFARRAAIRQTEELRHRGVRDLVAQGRLAEVPAYLRRTGVKENELHKYLPSSPNSPSDRAPWTPQDNQKRYYRSSPPSAPCPPPCDDHGGGGAAVGGVKLDKSAEMLLDINTVTGATYDPATGQLILLGQQDRRLPPMSMDDLAVAIRAAHEPVRQSDGSLALEPPGVSIDPWDPMHPEVRHDKMAVRYFAHTEGTAFGRVTFDADRFLKTASLGKDNITGQGFSTRVPGYRSLFDLWKTYPQNRSCPDSHRMWFFIGQVRLKETADGRSMVFDQGTNPIRVEARFVRWENGQSVDVPCSDPGIDAFVKHFNQHYDEFAHEEPALLKLQQLARVVAVVQWLRENQIPLDLSWISRYRIAAADTPKTTSAVTATSSAGNLIQTLYGGVELRLVKGKNLQIEKDEGAVAPTARATLAGRPDDMAIAWNVAAGGKTQKAVALSPAPAPIAGGYTTLETDISLASRGTWPLELSRGYNSVDPLPGPAGYGWSLAPFELRGRRSLTDQSGEPYSVYAYMVGADGRTTTFDVMRIWTLEKAVGPVSPSTARDGIYLGIAREVDGGRVRYRVWRDDLGHLVFDSEGRLVSLIDSSGNAVSYRYDARGQIEAIVGPDGRQRINLAYDSHGRLVQAKASTGQEVAYRYDAKGDLFEVVLPGNRRLTYAYDAAHRLISQALNGHILVQNSYDDLGRVVKQADGGGNATAAQYDRRTGRSVFTDASGKEFQQKYDASARSLAVTDPQGNTTTYSYDGQDNLVSVKDPRGNTTRLEYDDRGWMVGRVDPLGQKWQVLRGFWDQAGNEIEYTVGPDGVATKYTYDAQRRLAAVQEGLQVKRAGTGVSETYNPVQTRLTTFQYDGTGLLLGYEVFGWDGRGNRVPIGPATTLVYDELGRLKGTRTGGQSGQKYSYDALGRAAELRDVLGRAAKLTYDEADRVTGVSTAAGKVSYTYDELGRLVSITDPLGRTTGYLYDMAGNLIQVTEPNGVVTRYEYNAVGNLVSVIDGNQRRTSYEYDALGRLLEERVTMAAGTR